MKNSFSKCLGVAACICMAQMCFSGDFSLQELNLNHPDGIYQKSEEIVVTGTLLKAGQPSPDYSLRVITTWESVKPVTSQDFPCDGKPFRVSYKNDKPGWVYFKFQVVGPDGQLVKEPAVKNPQGKKELVGEIGAMIAPEEIRVADEEPADFDEFWKNEREKLDKVPMNPRTEKIDSGREGIELFTVKLDAGVSQPVTGYLALPVGAQEKSLPIFLSFLDGVNSDTYRNWALNMAARGAVALITTWHGFDVNREQKYYDENCGKIQSYKTATSREDFYFREVFVRAMRAADYLKSRPEWNGHDFLARGGSLAGAQTIAIAALDRQVTLALILVPSHSGYNADLAGRKRGLPFHWIPDAWMTPQMRKAVPYCDTAHLAKRITCECYFGTGFADEVCTPSNVFAAYNNVPKEVKKTMYTNPRTGHYGTTRDVNAEKRLEEFFQNSHKALQK